MITIREATSDDASAIAYVHIAGWRETYAGLVPINQLINVSYDQQVSTWFDILNTPQNNMMTFVAVNEQDRIVGFASAGYKGRNETQQRSGELYAVHLLNDYQRCGIGQQLVYTVVEYFIDMAIESMTTWVLVDDHARGFYEVNGGAVVDHKPIYVAQTELWEVCYAWFDLRDFGLPIQDQPYRQLALSVH